MAQPQPPLDRLEAETGVDLSDLRVIQEHSAFVTNALREACANEIDLPDGAAVVIVGSVGRGEVTSGSDVDHLIVTLNEAGASQSGRAANDAARAAVSDIVLRLGMRLPSGGGAFDEVVWVGELTSKVGGDAETNSLLTRRMLLLLESKPLLGDEVWQEALDEIRAGYLELGGPVKDRRPPRFLLNDIIRYWRTICVDFEGKMRGREGDGWGIRNAKLRTVRKMLFVGGLLPVLECHRFDGVAIDAFLRDRFTMTPVERVAEAALAAGAAADGAQALRAYGRFLQLVDDESSRRELDELREEERASSALWAEVKAIGEEFQQGLLGVLFSPSLSPVIREYAIF